MTPGSREPEKRQRWKLDTFLGPFTIGERTYDELVRSIIKGGFAATAFLLILWAWGSDRKEERADRRGQHAELVQLQRDQAERQERQHKEDIEARQRSDCINSQMIDTVRSAIWHEKPRPRGDCK